MSLALARATIPVALAGLGLLAAKAGDEPTKSTPAKAMRAIAGDITMRTPDGRTTFERVADPVYRFDDPTRSFSDGSVWAFGKAGRPPALLTISLKKLNPKTTFWLLEFTSIAGGAVAASDAKGGAFWEPDRPGVEMKPIPGAAAPEGDEARRLRQMRVLGRRFRGHEFFEARGGARDDRFEMRLLPRPVHRYNDPGRGIVDGAIFVMVYGQNPEIALVVEARRDGAGPAAWSYGVARISSARLHVDLDGHEVADFPQLSAHARTDVYGIATRPARDLGD